MSVFGANLKAIRQYRKITQKELGESLGLRQYVISRYETGRFEPSLEALSHLCRILNISSDELLGIKESKILTRLKHEIENKKTFLDNYEDASDYIYFTALKRKMKGQ